MKNDSTHDFLRGWSSFYASLRTGWNDITGDKAEYEEWRKHLEELPQYFPGSTGARFRGGWEGFLSDAVEGAGSSAPQAILMAGTAGSATPFVAGSATALQVGSTGLTSYGTGVADADNRAADLRRQADALDGGSGRPRLTPEQAQAQAAALRQQADELDAAQPQASLAQARALRARAAQYQIEAPETAAQELAEAARLEAQAKTNPKSPQAAALRQQAAQIESGQQQTPPAPSPEAAQEAPKLRAEADRIQAHRRLNAGASAAINIAADRLAPLERLPFAPTPGGYVRRFTNAAGKTLAENAATTTANQGLNHIAYGDAMDAGKVLHDTALGTVSGLPLTAGTAARGRSKTPEGKSIRVADTLTGDPSDITTTVAEAIQTLNDRLPGLVHEKTRVYNSVDDFLSSDYAKERSFTESELSGIQDAEGFFDRDTGNTIVIAGNVRLQTGEDARQGISRVMLHERVGHDGFSYLLGSDARFAERWSTLSGRIPDAELNLIARQAGYENIASNRNELALEWIARRAETDPTLLQKPGMVRDLWEAVKEKVRTAYEAMNGTKLSEPDLDVEVRSLLQKARDQAIKNPGKKGIIDRAPRTHSDGTAIDRLVFNIPMRQDKPNAWPEVKTGHSWMSSKRFLPKLADNRPSLQIVKRGSFEEKVKRVANWLGYVPKVNDPWGGSVSFANPQTRGGLNTDLENRAAHLLGENLDPKIEKRTEEPNKVSWIGATVKTIEDAQVRVRDPHLGTLYFRSYAEGVHMVIVENGVIKDQFALVSQYAPNMASQRFDGAVIERVR